MTDLLTPEEVSGIRGQFAACIMGNPKWGPDMPPILDHVPRICRNYLTLWDRNKELEALIPKRLIQRVGGTETGGP